MRKRMLRKRILSVISLLLVLTMICSLIGCGKTDADSTTKSFPSTGVNIVENGKSDYVIVVPEGNDYATNLAASELNTFLKQSSEVTLKITTDSGITFSDKEKYISLGQTTLLDSAGISVTKEDLGESGYIMKTVGNSLFISGITEATYNGTIYGVYDWLRYTVGYRCYSADEIVCDKMDTVPLYEFDEKYRPSIDVRELAFKELMTDSLYSYRMYTYSSNQGLWSSFAHTMVTTYLPYETYGAEHPDWYVANGDQVCLSNEEVLQEMILQVENRLDIFPNSRYVMIGREDNSTICTCEKCAATMAKYGNNYSGVELEFTNKIAKAVDEYMAQKNPDRQLKYFFFAYGPTLNAPTTYNEESQKYEPVYKDTEIYDNVGVLIAPITMDFSKAPTDSVNQAAYVSMKGWSDLFQQKNIAIWSYCLSPYAYMFNHNNFGVVQEYYRFFHEIGATSVYDQGNYDSAIPTFAAMRIYCQSQLGWDCTQNYEDLAMDFMDHYYGEAADAMKEYYRFIRAYYKNMDENDNSTGLIFFLMDDKNLWPMSTVQTLLSYMDDGLKAIEPLKENDPERYEQLYNRIQRERLSPLYMMLQYYITQLSEEEKDAYIADFEKYATMFAIEGTREGGFDINTIIQNWKNS